MPDTTFTRRSAMPASADDVYAWHARPGALARLTPPWETADVVGVEGTFGTPGYRVRVRTKLVGPVGGTMVAEHPSFTLLATGFAFDHPDLEAALRFILGAPTNRN